MKPNESKLANPGKAVRRFFRRHPEARKVFRPDSGPAGRPVARSWRNENPGEGGITLWQSGTVWGRDGNLIRRGQEAVGSSGFKLYPVKGGWESRPYCYPENKGIRAVRF